MSIIPIKYFQNEDVLDLAKSIIGKVLYTNINGKVTAGIITETEAYKGIYDKASHAYLGKKTKRNAPMFMQGGYSYVYLCYGIHHLFNIVTGPEDEPDAILIRSIQPYKGISIMEKRRKMSHQYKTFSNGPGKVAKSLGIETTHDSLKLEQKIIWLEDHNLVVNEEHLNITPRIGVDYAGEDAKLPYRYYYNAAFNS